MRTEEATGLVPRLAIFYAGLFVLPGIQMPFFPVWLEAKGVDAGTGSVQGFGFDKRKSSDKALNRRVEIVVVTR